MAPGKSNPWLAFGLSILVPGLGQLYAGRWRRAAGWFLSWIGAGYGCISWIISETRVNPAEGVAWYLILLLVGIGSWSDAYRVSRSSRVHRFSRPLAPGAALALSLLFPGLGHLFLLLRKSVRAGWWGLPLAAAALLVYFGSALESPPLPGWPRWLAGWPPLLGVFVGAIVSALAVAHAYAAGFQAGGGAGHASRLPRFSAAIWGLAVGAWLLDQAPWQEWLQSRIRSFYIPSSSMEPTLRIGDRILAKRRQVFSRGEIVVFQLASQPPGEYMVKRVAGCPGEIVALRDGRLLVGGRRVAEPFLRGDFKRAGDFGPSVVPEGSYFLLGDARAMSRDSRYFGAVPAERIYGLAYKRYWPVGRAAPLRPLY